MAYIDILKNILQSANVEIQIDGKPVPVSSLYTGDYKLSIKNKNSVTFEPKVNERYYIKLFPAFVTDMEFHKQFNYGYLPAEEMAGTITQISQDYVYGAFACTNNFRWYGWIPKVCVKEFTKL